MVSYILQAVPWTGELDCIDHKHLPGRSQVRKELTNFKFEGLLLFFSQEHTPMPPRRIGIKNLWPGKDGT